MGVNKGGNKPEETAAADGKQLRVMVVRDSKFGAENLKGVKKGGVLDEIGGKQLGILVIGDKKLWAENKKGVKKEGALVETGGKLLGELGSGVKTGGGTEGT